MTDLASGNATVNTRSDNAGNGGNIAFTQFGDILVTGERSRASWPRPLAAAAGSWTVCSAAPRVVMASPAPSTSGSKATSSPAAAAPRRSSRRPRPERRQHQHLPRSRRDGHGWPRRHRGGHGRRLDQQPGEPWSAGDDVVDQRDDYYRDHRQRHGGQLRDPRSVQPPRFGANQLGDHSIGSLDRARSSIGRRRWPPGHARSRWTVDDADYADGSFASVGGRRGCSTSARSATPTGWLSRPRQLRQQRHDVNLYERTVPEVRGPTPLRPGGLTGASSIRQPVWRDADWPDLHARLSDLAVDLICGRRPARFTGTAQSATPGAIRS